MTLAGWSWANMLRLGGTSSCLRKTLRSSLDDGDATNASPSCTGEVDVTPDLNGDTRSCLVLFWAGRRHVGQCTLCSVSIQRSVYTLEDVSMYIMTTTVGPGRLVCGTLYGYRAHPPTLCTRYRGSHMPCTHTGAEGVAARSRALEAKVGTGVVERGVCACRDAGAGAGARGDWAGGAVSYSVT